MHPRYFAILALLFPLLGFAQETRPNLQPRPITIAGKMNLTSALDFLQKQSGNVVKDRRASKDDSLIEFNVRAAPFWLALEDLAVKTGSKISLYEADGAIALVQGAPRKSHVTYPGIFRVAASRITTIHDWETDKHLVNVSLEIAWEPRFQPFYLEMGKLTAIFDKDLDNNEATQTTSPRGAVSIAGRSATEVAVVLPAPPRSVSGIKSLSGAFKVIGPAKMLTFTFDKLKAIVKGDAPRSESSEDVRVTLTKLTTGPDRWTVGLAIDNPPGGPVFESYQTWLSNNDIWFERTVNGKKDVWRPAATDQREAASLTATHAALEYFFRDPERIKSSKLPDWVLSYRTPGNIVELEVPFTLDDLPLP